MGDKDESAAALLEPDRLWTRAEVLARPCPVPAEPGVYSWWFRSLPGVVDAIDCRTFDGSTLLYVGISPKAPPTNGRPPSSQNIRKRIQYHYCGNAAGSTLRLTLGCLLRGELGIELRRVGSGQRMTFTPPGEAALNEWMGANARVTWVPVAEPWVAESAAIVGEVLPLNLDQNRHHAFHPVLSRVRREAKEIARSLPVFS